MFRRLRARLDQVQGEANETMSMAQDLIADLRDGFGVTVHVEANALAKLLKAVSSGGGFDLPITVKVVPAIDAEKE